MTAHTGDGTARSGGELHGENYTFTLQHDPLVMWSRLLLRDPRARKLIRPDAAGCWIWVGTCDPSGYAHLTRDKIARRAHRYLYELLVGPIADGLHLDHLCRVRNCVNPAHLEPVTPLENTRRGTGHGSETHCPQGHPYSGDNLGEWAGRRYCRTCNTARAAAWRRARASARTLEEVAS